MPKLNDSLGRLTGSGPASRRLDTETDDDDDDDDDDAEEEAADCIEFNAGVDGGAAAEVPVEVGAGGDCSGWGERREDPIVIR